MHLVEFLPLKEVVKKVGLSKSEIYRQIADGRFPSSRPYKDNPKRRFWLSTDVAAWQQEQLQ